MKNINTMSGYSKIPLTVEYSSWTKMSKEQLDLYHKEQRVFESFLNMCRGYLDGVKPCKLYTVKYQKSFLRKHFNKLYVDYSIYYGTIFSAYTQYGVKQIDSNFCHQIQILGNSECLFTFDELKECILRQPNLHPIIRNNLYNNLMNYVK